MTLGNMRSLGVRPQRMHTPIEKDVHSGAGPTVSHLQPRTLAILLFLICTPLETLLPGFPHGPRHFFSGSATTGAIG